MMEEKLRKEKAKLMGIFTLGLFIGALCYWGYIVANPPALDMDCLIQQGLAADVDEWSRLHTKGYVDMNWTLANLVQGYYDKYPQSHLALKAVGTYYYNLCSE